MQNDRVCKKLKLTNDKDKELDLEKIMDDLHTLPDIVLNQPFPTADNGSISYDKLPLNQSSPIASEAEVSENELSGVTAPCMPNDIAKVAVTAAIENITGNKSVCGATDSNVDNNNLTT